MPLSDYYSFGVGVAIESSCCNRFLLSKQKSLKPMVDETLTETLTRLGLDAAGKIAKSKHEKFSGRKEECVKFHQQVEMTKYQTSHAHNE